MRFTALVAATWGILYVAEAAQIVQLTLQPSRKKRPAVALSSLATSANLGARVGFRPAHGNVFRTARGVSRQRLVETYGNLEVIGAAASVEIDWGGQLTGHMYGSVAIGLQSDIPDPDACQNSVAEMLEIAIRAENYEVDDPNIDNKDGRRVVWVDPDTNISSLAYRVEFLYANDRVISCPAYFIDACEKSVILHFDQIQNVSIARGLGQADDECPEDVCDPSAAGEGGNLKTGKIVYNTEGRCLDVQKVGNMCTMTNTYARVIDNEQRTTRSKQTPVSFTCDEGYDDAINGAYGVASDAMYFGTITGTLYEEKYNFRALPYAPRLVVHYSSCFDNAFWDGTDMYFGDGCSLFYPLVSQDVVTHELAHGITTRNSNLVYANQPGGINEAFSDISGEVGEVFGRGSNDWKVGYELFKGDRSLRYFINPPDDDRSIKHVQDYFPFMGVHFSSGVFNHAFYQLVAEEGMPIYDAYKCFIDANLLVWSSTTRFWRGACGVMQACFDNGFSHAMVRRAFKKVGINLLLCDFDALSTSLAAGETRDEVLVSATRNPILAVENKDGTVTVVAVAEDLSPVAIEVSSDLDGKDILATGADSVQVDSEVELVHAKLSSASDADVKVAVAVQ